MVTKGFLSGVPLAVIMLASTAPARTPTSPAAIVQQQVETFNRGDLDGFVACYADDVEVYALGSDSIPALKGREAFVARYAPLFRAPHPHVTIVSRQVNGSFVVDQERTVSSGRTDEGFAIYEVRAGRIARVWFTP